MWPKLCLQNKPEPPPLFWSTLRHCLRVSVGLAVGTILGTPMLLHVPPSTPVDRISILHVHMLYNSRVTFIASIIQNLVVCDAVRDACAMCVLLLSYYSSLFAGWR